MMKKGIWKTIDIFVLFSFLITGCSNFGPKQLTVYQSNYNDSLNHGSNQEILLNIVRLAYGDTPYFLTVSSISAQLEFTASASSDVTISKDSFGSSAVYTVGPSISYTQRPTITYTPMQGSDFARRMLEPIDMNDLHNFSTWSIARTLRVTCKSVGNLVNSENASRPTSDTAPVYYQNFINFAHLFRKIQEKSKVTMSIEKIKNKLQIQASFSDMHDPDTQKAFSMLDVPTTYNHIIFVQSDHKGVSANIVNVQTRSFLQILYYLSKSVEIPPEHLKSGITGVSKNLDGTAFNWKKVTRGMITVHSSLSIPQNTAVVIYYHNYWFYIADNDQESKKTFSMLCQLYALLSKDITLDNRPVLTLPV